MVLVTKAVSVTPRCWAHPCLSSRSLRRHDRQGRAGHGRGPGAAKRGVPTPFCAWGLVLCFRLRLPARALPCGLTPLPPYCMAAARGTLGEHSVFMSWFQKSYVVTSNGILLVGFQSQASLILQGAVMHVGGEWKVLEQQWRY